MVPLVILSRERVRTPSEMRATGKPAVLIMANIHAGEVEGKEACQMLIREVASGRLAALLDHQVILVIPIFNADGNDKLGKNRHDKGPEVAGVRYNGQYLDLNRDYTKLESPEVTGARAAVQHLGPGPGRGHAHHQRLLPPRARELHDLRQRQRAEGTGRLHVEEAPPRRSSPAQEGLRLRQRPLRRVRRGRESRQGLDQRGDRGALRDQLRRAAQPAIHPRRELLLRRLQDQGAGLVRLRPGRSAVHGCQCRGDRDARQAR